MNGKDYTVYPVGDGEFVWVAAYENYGKYYISSTPILWGQAPPEFEPEGSYATPDPFAAPDAKEDGTV